MDSSRFHRLLKAAPAVQRAVLRRRLGRLTCEEVQGIPLVVLPDVFNPAIFRSSDVFVRALRTLVPAADALPRRVLDMGTGSGVLAVATARFGVPVVAVDVNPEAVRCARINALLNRQEHAIEIREGDLFEPVGGERFELVLFNPPFFSGAPRSALDRAWRSTDVPERFAAGLPDVLSPGGHALVCLSSHGGSERTLAALHRAGMATATAFSADMGDEVFTIVDAHRPGGPR